MRELSPDLLARVRLALLRSGAFDHERDVAPLFVDARLCPWRADVPAADTPKRRVDALLAALRDRQNERGEPALALLLRVLAEQCDAADARQQELAGLAAEVERALKGAVFIAYKRKLEPDYTLAHTLYHALTARGYGVFIDETMRAGAAWLDEIDRQLGASDFLVVLLSEDSAHSEMVQAEVQRAYEYRQEQGRPETLPVRIAYEGRLPYALAAFVNQRQYILWRSAADDARVIDALLAALEGRVTADEAPPPAFARIEDMREAATPALHAPLPVFDPRSLTTPGGVVRLSDPCYIRRDADAELEREIVGAGTVTTIRAARQSGKSSLLARGLAYAAEQGAQTLLLDMQQTDPECLASYDRFLRYIADAIAAELFLDAAQVERAWQGPLGAQSKLTFWLERQVLPGVETRLVLALDEVDRLLDRPFHADFFALLRAWFNRAASKPVWEKLNQALVISTEPHLLIPDTNQSPFNVGLKLYLQDFTPAQVAALNRLHGAPVRDADLSQLMDLLGGHPYLTRKALFTLVTKGWTWVQLAKGAVDEQGPFGDHLRRYDWLLRNAPDLRDALRQILRQRACHDELAFFRLLQAGLVKGSGAICVYRCDLYRQYFEGRL